MTVVVADAELLDGVLDPSESAVLPLEPVSLPVVESDDPPVPVLDGAGVMVPVAVEPGDAVCVAVLLADVPKLSVHGPTALNPTIRTGVLAAFKDMVQLRPWPSRGEREEKE